MKNITILCVCLLLAGTALANIAQASRESAHSDDAVQVFWGKFKAAVGKGDAEAVAGLSRFPIEMSYGMASIKNKAQLRRRYREVFNQQTKAATCFSKAQPEMEAGKPKRFTVACPDAAGNEVVIYHFELTASGWKFTALDNLNE